ncbi:HpcH/HpaI aldolase/citrate lyase family protein [Halosimplex halophilum]|uniref:HpcH/HpaI aldolase/citrate lyase family protein n=1 Tax=Halosimplex halophilum TaxID=2559572 RepID=UPI00107F0514|nr:CoA ester lyase [Halosimplex halophilum]
MVRRSLLYTPGDDRDMLETAVETDADAVIFDLEDAVAPDARDDARETVRATLDDLDDPGPELCVRINPYDRCGRDDVDAVVGDTGTPPDSIVLPKAEGAADVAQLRDHLVDLGADDIDVIPLVETAAGIVAVEETAAAPGVDAVAYGDQDYTADVGATVTDEKTESLYARQRVVAAAGAAGVGALDTVYTDIEDREGLREQTQRVVEFGFDGKLAIHPDQVPVINEAFTPDAESIEWAERVVEGQRAAETDGTGVFTVDGQMIDPPLVERAERILDRADAADAR